MVRLRRIQGESLAPAYRDGDFVVSSRIPFLFRQPRQGDLIIFRHPHHGVLIKRVESIDATGSAVRVTGSNPESLDSREFGAIPQSDILGKVISHIQKPRR